MGSSNCHGGFESGKLPAKKQCLSQFNGPWHRMLLARSTTHTASTHHSTSMTWSLITTQKVRKSTISVLIIFIIISTTALDASLHDIGQNGLVLVRPQHPQPAQRVKRRFKALQKSDETTSALFDVLDSDDGTTTIYLSSFC